MGRGRSRRSRKRGKRAVFNCSTVLPYWRSDVRVHHLTVLLAHSEHLASGTGKSTALIQLLRNHKHVFETPLVSCIVVYSVWTRVLAALRESPPVGVRVFFTQRVPTLDVLAKFIDTPSHKEGSTLILFEDIQVRSDSLYHNAFDRTTNLRRWRLCSNITQLTAIIFAFRLWARVKRQLLAVVATLCCRLDAIRTPTC